MTEEILLAAAILGGAVLLFGLSLGVGILISRRIDRILQARLASSDARVAEAPTREPATDAEGPDLAASAADQKKGGW